MMNINIITALIGLFGTLVGSFIGYFVSVKFSKLSIRKEFIIDLSKMICELRQLIVFDQINPDENNLLQDLYTDLRNKLELYEPLYICYDKELKKFNSIIQNYDWNNIELDKIEKIIKHLGKRYFS